MIASAYLSSRGGKQVQEDFPNPQLASITNRSAQPTTRRSDHDEVHPPSARHLDSHALTRTPHDDPSGCRAGAPGPACRYTRRLPSGAHYRVEVGVINGEATLFALRNTILDATANADIIYYDKNGNIRTVEQVSVAGAAVLTRNLRDVPSLLPDADGIARGYVTIVSDRPLSGDIFHVDLNNDFADGSRAVEFNDVCQRWDIRFIQGGVFSGGTRLYL